MRPHFRHKRPKNSAASKKSRNRKIGDNTRKMARNSPPLTVEITHIGSRGDGVGQAEFTLDYEQKSYPVFVPETLPGEIVIAQPQQVNAQGIRAELIELTQASPDRRPAPLFGVWQMWRLSASASEP